MNLNGLAALSRRRFLQQSACGLGMIALSQLLARDGVYRRLYALQMEGVAG